MQGVLKEPNLLAEAGQGLLGAGMSYLKGDMSGAIAAGTQLLKKFTSGRAAKETARRTKTSPADVIQFSGCKDDQTSADAVEQVSSLLPLHLFVRN
jgi:metacaspase-1